MSSEVTIKSDREKPWLDQEGQPLSTEDLKEACKAWGGSMWENYLHWYEPIIEEDETLDFKRDIENLIVDSSSKQIYAELFEVKSYKSVKGLIERCMSHKMTRKQAKVLKLYYWKDLSVPEVAEEMNLSRATVYRLMNDAQHLVRLACHNSLVVNNSQKTKPSPYGESVSQLSHVYPPKAG